ncbi:GNAT family N-acetyltransferase [Sutcliffiella halmapala]|uniref:GNAT family N-acetyltransferase n=1 Tax=Sutcliffiella halmapala TaxID=79882 RepID=UPI00099547D2|nr:GNAT family protein [Sutcliffiella halmapala]
MFVIQGNKLQLKALEKEDLSILWELIYGEEEPEYKKWDAPYFPLERIAFSEYETSMSKLIENGFDSQRLIVVEGKIIGTVTYYWEHQPSNWMEVGIIIYLPEYWSGGYGTEAIKLWVDYLFENYPNIPRIGYTTWSGNRRMIQVGKKLGMQEEARIRKARTYNGELYDSVKMGVLREEWEALYGH